MAGPAGAPAVTPWDTHHAYTGVSLELFDRLLISPLPANPESQEVGTTRLRDAIAQGRQQFRIAIGSDLDEDSVHARRGYLRTRPTPEDADGVGGGDVTGDGRTDIIAAPKQDGSANVRVYSYTASTSSIDLLDWLMAYQTGYRQPIELTAADFDADGDAEIMVTPLGAGGPNVRILDFADNELSLSSWFMAYADSFRGGVRAAIGQQ